MCEPISASAMTYISLASAAVSTYAQMETSKAQAEQIGVQQENERREAHEIAEEELGVRVKEAREKRSRARVAAGESGALGASFAAQINQSLQDQDETAAKVAKGVEFAHRGIDDRAASALASTRGPSSLEAGLNIAGAGASAFNAGIAARRKQQAAATGPIRVT